jgi:signal transduction histidine kinase
VSAILAALWRRTVRVNLPVVVIATSAVAIALADYFLVAPPGAFKLPRDPGDIVLLTALIGAAAMAAATSRVSRYVVFHQERAETLAKELSATRVRGNLLLDLGARALAGGGVEAICHDAATMTVTALGVEHSAIFKLSSDGEDLVLVTASGWDASAVEGLVIPADIETQAGYALHAREPIVVDNASSDTRFTLPQVLRAKEVRSGIVARIAAGGRPAGVLAAYSTSRRVYTADEAQFVANVANALAAMYERRRLENERADLVSRDKVHRASADVAIRRAAFLAQTVTVFDAALDPEATLVNLARLAVPALAECAIVDLVLEDGHVRRVEVIDIDPTRRDTAQAVRRQAPNLRTESPFSRAIRTGQPALVPEVPHRSGDNGNEPAHTRLMKLLESRSLLLIPLVARGQTLGLLTLASRDAARQYDAADLAVAQELAGRAAIALDNARLYRESQVASRTKDEFLAMVSHELRTPINAVLGWAAMLREHRLDATRAEHACDAIERSARQQAHMLEQLLDVSRAISGKLEVRAAPAQLAAIVSAALDAVGPEAEEKNVRLTSRLDRGLPLMMVDPDRLQQVVVNIVSNAVKFSPEDGAVDVELHRDESHAQIVVRDHGIGIKREFLPYIFDRFRQGDADARNGNRGLGLGMSIARDIVERHGGTITADSTGEGEGATFTVRLPLRAVAEAPVPDVDESWRAVSSS